MSGWRTLKMREVMLEFYDGPHATPPPASDGPIYLGIRNIADSGALDLREVRHISESDFERWTKRARPQPDDVVFVYEATLHRYALIPKGFRGCLGRRLALIRPDTSVVLPRFLHLAMLGKAWRATVTERIISGATVDRIPILTFPDFPIELPDLPTQRAIVEVLGSIDDLIENIRRRVETLERMVLATYREWFVHHRYEGHERDRFTDSHIGSIPDNWEAARTGDLIHRGIMEIGDGYRAKNVELTSDGMPFIRVANVRVGYLDLQACDHLPFEYARRLGSKVSRPGDCVISMKGTVGRVAVVDDRTPVSAYSPQVSYWRTLDPQVLRQSFLRSWMQSPDFRTQCARVKGATDMADYVNLKDQRAMTILLPPADIQSEFDDRVGPALRAADVLRAEATVLAAQRDLLLPRLIAGEIEASASCVDSPAEEALA